MTLPIYIPSRGRAKNIGEGRNTIAFIKKATFVVPEDEFTQYASRLTRHFDFTGNNYGVIVCPVDGIAGTRFFIGMHAQSLNQSKFLMLDDDLIFSVRKSPDTFNLRASQPEDIAQMLDWTETMLDAYAHVGISPRQGNNVVSKGYQTDLTLYNKRTIRYLAYQTAPFLKMEHGRVPVMEDFDVNLQLLRAGYPNAISFWWAQDQRETGMTGGCSVYRNEENHDAAARKLAELHHPFVTLRKKVNKTGKLKERTEVTIQWQKAFKS